MKQNFPGADKDDNLSDFTGSLLYPVQSKKNEAWLLGNKYWLTQSNIRNWKPNLFLFKRERKTKN